MIAASDEKLGLEFLGFTLTFSFQDAHIESYTQANCKHKCSLLPPL